MRNIYLSFHNEKERERKRDECESFNSNGSFRKWRKLRSNINFNSSFGMTKDTVGRNGRIRASLTPDCSGNERTRTVRQHRGKITQGSVIPCRPAVLLVSSLSFFLLSRYERESPDSTFRTRATEISCYNGAALILTHSRECYFRWTKPIFHYLALSCFSNTKKKDGRIYFANDSPDVRAPLLNANDEFSGEEQRIKYIYICAKEYTV